MTEGNKKTIKIVGLIFVMVGIAGFAYPFVYGFFNNEEIVPEKNVPIIQAQLPTFAGLIVVPILSPNSNSEEQNRGSSISQPRQGGGEIGTTPRPAVIKDHLIIAGADINMPVFLGPTEKTLNRGGWLFPNTSRPELGGNSVIFGHRYMYRPPKSNTFWNLDKVKIGDEMVLFWHGKEYKYRVNEIKIVEPEDLSVMRTSTDSRLTVITCTPLFTTKQRLVVIGTLLSVK